MEVPPGGNPESSQLRSVSVIAVESVFSWLIPDKQYPDHLWRENH